MNYTLEIWKLDQNENFTSDDPFFSDDFYTEDCPEWEEPQERINQAEGLIKRHMPTIDCAGFRAIIYEKNGSDRTEIDSIQKMF